MKRLYSVTASCEFEIPVYAEHAAEAIRIARKNLRRELDDNCPEWDLHSPNPVSVLPGDWEGSSPWGKDHGDDRTCDDILADLAREKGSAP